MIFQGWPFWQLSQSYKWDPLKFYNTLTHFVALLGPAEAHAGNITAGVETLFGPKKYIRTKGKPNTYTDGFGIQGLTSKGTLVVKNGDNRGKHRISSALIYLNGVQIFGPSDFNQQVGRLEAPVTLSNSNTIFIELRSKPEGFLIIEIINYLPVANAQSVITEEDTPLAIVLSGSDAESEVLTYAIDSSPSHGSLNGTPPNVTYTSEANYNGPDAFSFTVNDGASTSEPGTVTITVTPVNDPPEANNDAAELDEDTFADVPVLANDSDVDGDELTVTVVVDCSDGTVVANEHGTCKYTPNSNFNGTDSFTYRVDDGHGGTAEATVALTIHPVNDPPMALPQSVALDEDSSLEITLIGTDVDGDSLTYALSSQPKEGSLSGNPPNLTYTPEPDYYGPDSFEFTVNDGTVTSSPAAISINVLPVNDAPVADAGPDQNHILPADQTEMEVKLDGTGSSDKDGVIDSYLWLGTPDPDDVAEPIVSIPPGMHIFTLRVTDDGGATSELDSVTITIIAPPVLSDIPGQTILEGESFESINLDDFVKDLDNSDEEITWSVSGAAELTVTIDANRVVTIDTPNEDWNGSETCTFKATDPQGLFAEDSATFTVTPVNDVPQAEDDSVTTDEDTPLDISAASLLANDTDVDGDTLSIASFTVPSNGTLSDNDNGTYTYTPSANFNGDDSFTYTISDGNDGTDTATVSITVNPVNDPPAITSTPITATTEGELYGYDVEATDPDENDVLTFSLDIAPSGMVIEETTGLIQWTPDGSQLGDNNVIVRVQDTGGLFDTQAFIVSVANANHPPAIEPVNDQVMDENATLTVPISCSDSDNDELTLTVYGLPSFANFTDNGDGTGSITFMPGFQDADAYLLFAMVSDGVRNDSDDFTLTVNDVNRPPIASAGGPYEGVVETSIPFDGSLSVDPDADSLTYFWIFGDGSAGEEGVEVAHAYSQPGTYLVSLTVNDGKGGTDTDNTVSVTVHPPPEIDLEPVLVDLSELTVDPQTLELTGSVSVEIQNNGLTDVSDSHELVVFEDINRNDALDEGTDHVFGTSTVGTGPQGESSVTVTVDVSGNVLFGGNRIHAFVDRENEIAETNEDNNITHNMAGCEYFPPVGQFDPVVEAVWGTPSDQPAPERRNVVMAPVVANLTDDNGDGKTDLQDLPDIAFVTGQNIGSCKGTLRIISLLPQGEVVTHASPHSLLDNTGGLAVGDLTGDGVPEIVAMLREYLPPAGYAGTIPEGTVALQRASDDGSAWSILWENNSYPRFYRRYHTEVGSQPLIADLDADGNPEVIIGNVVLNGQTGALVWDGIVTSGGTGGKGHNGYFGPVSTVGDPDLDGYLEVAAGKTLYEYDGSVQWTYTYTSNNSVCYSEFGCDGFTAMANFDDDPHGEIVIVRQGEVYVLEHDGQLKYKVPIPHHDCRGPYGIMNEGGPPTVADFDGDGRPEIGVASSDYYAVFDLDCAGTDRPVECDAEGVLWKMPNRDCSSRITGSTVFDFEGDGKFEVVYADERDFWIFAGTDGTVLFRDEGHSSHTRLEMPVIADVDNDGNAEVVVPRTGRRNGIRIWGDANDTWVNTRKIWNQHAYSITNVNEDGTIPQHPANNWETFNNFRCNQSLDARACADVTASYVRVDNANLPDSMDVLARVGNGGALHIVPGTNVAFYEGDPASGGILLDVVQTTTTLYPGAYEEIVFTYESPTSQLYEIYVVADDDGTGTGDISEINEENNKAYTHFDYNRRPSITSEPITTGEEGQAYSYGVEATDPDSDPLNFSLTASPEGMEIDPDTGLITWTPDGTQAGDHTVEVRVDDGQGSHDTQDYVLTIAEAINSAPEITSSPETSIFDSDDYTYQVTADDADGDSLTFELTTAPTGMAISPAGLITWPESLDRPIAAEATVVVSDGRGGEDTQNWYITVNPVPPPDISIAVNPDPSTVGDTVNITLSITSHLPVVESSLTVNGEPLTLVDNQATYTSTEGGAYSLEATATNEKGLTGTASTTFYVKDPSDTEFPTVEITSPYQGQEITEPIDIIGTAYDPNLLSYSLAYAPAGTDDWRALVTSSTPVTNDVLGKFDPTLLANGLYDIRLSAIDAGLNVISDMVTCEVTGRLKIGQFSLAFEDITVPVSGIPITVTRTYNSFDKEKGDFGVGWDMSLGTGVKIQVTRTLGYYWYAVEDYCFQWFLGQCLAWVYKIETPRVPKVLVTYADGRQDRFEFTPVFSTQPPLDPEYLTATFTPLEGTTSSLEVFGISDLILVGGTSGDTLYDLDMEPFDPDLFRLTTADGMVLILSRSQGLKSITDRNGNKLTFGPDGVSHSSGLSINIERDAQDRITKITDPMGYEVKYEYDENGDLVEFTDQEAYLTEFGYDSDHNLNSIIDPRGIEILQTEYDEQGRMIGTVDGLGNDIEIEHDIDNAIEYVTDRRGYTTAYEYDSDGNIVFVTDPVGNITQYTYDDRGNELSKTDALGNITSWTYDNRDNKLTETDPLGNITAWTYNSRNQILTVTDPLGNVTSYTYDSDGNLQTKTDALGSTTAHTYDSRGNRLTMTDCEGNVWTYTYDAYGNRLTETDPLGNVTTYTYDDNGNVLTVMDALDNTTTKEYDNFGRVIRITDPLGHVTNTEYNALGKKSADIDKSGNRKEYEYDETGNLVLTTYPDGTSETNTYDANGNRISSINRAGRTTQYEYDALKYGDSEEATQNRLTRIIHPDGSSTSLEYDALSRITATIDENGNRTATAYDADGRRESTTDALGNVTTFTYGANGNQTSMTDANGNTTTFEYDALNRRTRTIFPDGTSTSVVYAPGCSEERKLSETDQAGNTTSFDYDAMGRLVRVTDALGGETTYTYDAVGNKLTQTDPNGHTTSWTYDSLKRAVSRTLPMGQTETSTYDANGNLLSKTDFNGNIITYTYDTLNRLIRKQYPDSSEVSFTYTATGRRERATDSRGVTIYTYDVRDRILSVTHPDSTVISYSYDNKGNRTSVTVPSGTTTYAYDALNRPVDVTDANGGVITYTYDNVGNRASVVYPNGTVAEYTYDALNRLTHLENRRSSEEVISSYSYSLGPAGNRLSVTEDTGRVVNYSYDSLYRLRREEITDAVLGNDTIEYTYDAFGNRLTKTHSSGTTTYTYNANDQLIIETGTGYSYTYTYDNNGNTTNKTDGTLVTTYGYDYENRLISTEDPSGVTNYIYDVDGIRVMSETAGDVTTYLVDKNRRYAQVLEETDDSDGLMVSYVYGDDLISQNGSGGLSYYHYDGQMSTRKLTDGSEGITDSYVYDAFGVTLDHSGTTENNYLYTGEQYDPNIGFYYLRARYYVPELGRFQTMDDWPGIVYDPRSLHKYSYANVDPVNKLDPSGRLTLVQKMVVISIIGIFSLIATPAYGKKKEFAAAYLAMGNLTGVDMAYIHGVANRIANQLREKGYTIIRNNAATEGQIRSMLATANVKGFVFIGHGGPDPHTSRDRRPFILPIDGVIYKHEVDSWPKHHMDFVVLHACYSAAFESSFRTDCFFGYRYSGLIGPTTRRFSVDRFVLACIR
jgi:RHS repeat-associated protein